MPLNKEIQQIIFYYLLQNIQHIDGYAKEMNLISSVPTYLYQPYCIFQNRWVDKYNLFIYGVKKTRLYFPSKSLLHSV